jgi:hypothetical protein
MTGTRPPGSPKRPQRRVKANNASPAQHSDALTPRGVVIVEFRGDGTNKGHASLSHFFMKLVFAARASGFPFLSIAFGSQAFFVHFVMKLFKAAPASCFPSFPTALL